MKKKNLVYVALAADILHEGHINIFEDCQNMEKSYWITCRQSYSILQKFPHLTFKQRYSLLKILNMFIRLFLKKLIIKKI